MPLTERPVPLIEKYTPEFVARFAVRTEACDCPACRQNSADGPRVTLRWHNQERDSLMLTCATACRELLFNPQAFLLHESATVPVADASLSPWLQQLNQQCINLAIHPALTLEESLYAIGVLLSKAQQWQERGETDPERLLPLGEQLTALAEQGTLRQQMALLPRINEKRTAVLKAMGAMRLNPDLPLTQKMPLMLKLSELAIMPPERLSERLLELENHWQQRALFEQQPHVLRNLLLYWLYHSVFPGEGVTHFGAAFLTLSQSLLRLKMLCALWLSSSPELTEDDIVTLCSAYFQWRQSAPLVAEESQSADCSLLTGLALL